MTYLARTIVSFTMILAWHSPHCFAAAEPAVEVVGGEETVAHIVRTWELRRQAIRRITAELAGWRITPKGTTRQRRSQITYPAADTLSEFRTVWSIDFDKLLVRKEDKTHVYTVPLGTWRPHNALTIYDGKSVLDVVEDDRTRTSDGEPSGPRIKMSTDELAHHRVFMIWDQPLFFAHGVQYVKPDDSLRPLTCRPVTAADFVVHRAPKDIGGREVEQVVRRAHSADDRNGRINEYVIDLGQQCSVRTVRTYVSGALYHQAHIDYELVDGSWWMPTHWVIATYSRNGALRLAIDVTVNAVSVNPVFATETFEIDRNILKASGAEDELRSSIGEKRVASQTGREGNQRATPWWGDLFVIGAVVAALSISVCGILRLCWRNTGEVDSA